MNQTHNLAPDFSLAHNPENKKEHQLKHLAASFAAGMLALIGGCSEKTVQEPAIVLPDASPGLAKSDLIELKNEQWELKYKLEEVQTGQAIFAEALSHQNLPLDREFVEALKNNSGITLQWIKTERRGELIVTESADGIVSMSGKQISDDGQETLSLAGQVVLNTPAAFVMLGTIDISLTRYREEGTPLCRREGAFTFRRTGERKYWRLLEKHRHCDYGTDYIDIYL
ncbi:MAG: hypothetical protein ACK4MQ_11130 [Hyphomonas sp.]